MKISVTGESLKFLYHYKIADQSMKSFRHIQIGLRHFTLKTSQLIGFIYNKSDCLADLKSVPHPILILIGLSRVTNGRLKNIRYADDFMACIL